MNPWQNCIHNCRERLWGVSSKRQFFNITIKVCSALLLENTFKLKFMDCTRHYARKYV